MKRIPFLSLLLAGFSFTGNAAVSTAPSRKDHPELYSSGDCHFSALSLRGRTDQGPDSANGARMFIMGLSGDATLRLKL